MSQQLRHGVNIRALHSEPRRGRVPEVVKLEIVDFRRLRRASANNARGAEWTPSLGVY
jgi:hypothetical protein